MEIKEFTTQERIDKLKTETMLLTDEKEITEKQKELVDLEKKTILSNDAYAVCGFMECLINKIEHARLSMMRK